MVDQAFPIQDAERPELSWTHYRKLITLENTKARPRSHAPAWECIRKVLYAAKVSCWYNSSARNDLEQVGFLEVYREW